VVVAGCTTATAGSAPPVASPTTSTTASADPSSSTLTAIGAGLRGPAGLSATAYATGLTNVSAFAFDPDGHLWAATAAYDDAGTDAVYEVTTDGVTPMKVIADLHTPLGLVWAGDTLYLASAGRVDAYTGLTDGTFARHTMVLTLSAGVGEVNGLVMSPAGRLVLGVSAPCDACTPTTEDAAAVLSFLPDGSDLRVVAGGIRAPVGLAYYPGTDDLFVTMNQRDDLGDATPGDWLSVVRDGQAWGFPDCYGQGGSACSGAPTPVAVLDKHAAVSGVAIVTDGLGASVGPSALVAEWATGVVLRVALTNDGTTYTGTVEPFLTGLTKPVPIVTAPDGSVFVGDWGTGTVYRIAAD
jgi:glucose/arabinose dehydrogenase